MFTFLSNLRLKFCLVFFVSLLAATFATHASIEGQYLDITPPSPTSVTTSGWSIDDNDQPQINFTVIAEDDLSGIQFIVIELLSPTGSGIQRYGNKVAENTYEFNFKFIRIIR